MHHSLYNLYNLVKKTLPNNWLGLKFLKFKNGGDWFRRHMEGLAEQVE